MGIKGRTYGADQTHRADAESREALGEIRSLMSGVEWRMQSLPESNQKNRSLAKLEESFMWAEMAIRLWQIQRENKLED